MVFKDKHDRIFYSSTHLFTYIHTHILLDTLPYEALTHTVLKGKILISLK